MLQTRGIQLHEVKSFFNPDLENLPDPFLMKGMDIAVSRISHALEHQEKILVYGDYDVDGTTGVALFRKFLSEAEADVAHYIPDRYTEGYGLSKKGVEFALTSQFKLMVLIDCGIRSNELIEYAQKQGMDVIVCDHHIPGSEIPKALAVLDPKQNDCPYPFKELSGCGIAFKLAQGLCNRTRYWAPEAAFKYLDLVAVSTCCDIVPIQDENRILVHHGLRKLNENPSIGLKLLLAGTESAGSQAFSVSDVVFRIGPRINAAGRIESGNFAVQLLTTDDQKEASEWVSVLQNLNQTRTDLDQNITKEAFELIQNDDGFGDKCTTVLYSENWHKGVIGIVASRIMEKYYRPTIVLTLSDGVITGSARSVDEVDVHDVLCHCHAHLLQFGGHSHAAGLKMLPENLDSFRRKFEEEVRNVLKSNHLQPTFWYEAELDLNQIQLKLHQNISRFGPFGPGNMEPVFMARNVQDSGFARTLGKNHEHLKLNLKLSQGEVIPAIAFQKASWYSYIKKGLPFDVLYTIGTNTFRDEIKLQLEIKDIRLPENLSSDVSPG